MNKAQLIQEYLQKPIEINDVIDFNIVWFKDEQVKIKGQKGLQPVSKENNYNGSGIVKEINSEEYVLKINYFSKCLPNFIKRDYNTDTITVNKNYCVLNTSHIGYNPTFSKELKINEHRQTLESLLYKVKSKDRNINELNWNPILNTKEGVLHYQRDFCWSLQDKQILIESIYNQINIGKFVFRKRGYDYAVRYYNDPIINGCYLDIVDGKQRFQTILEFVDNKISDLSGHYYKDFSETSKRKFNNYFGLTIVELEEDTTDEDVKELFLKINFSGVQMSREHLDFVKSINLK